MRQFLRRFRKDEAGQAVVEYSVLVAITLGTTIATITALGANINAVLGPINALLAAAAAA
jgi:Flp pilus assembly pilin Flp